MSDDRATPSAPPSPGGRWALVIFAGILAVAAWQLTRAWHSSILDRYEFRQLQTSLSIFWMKQEGLKVDYSTPLFGPPWMLPMEFPTYQWCVTLLSNATGMELEQAGRLMGIGFYLAMLPAVYGLLALAELTGPRRLLVLALILVTPVYLFYPRTVMIESTALCLAVWFLYALHRALATRGWGWVVAAGGFAVLAALTKITTFALYAVAGACLTIATMRAAGRANGGRFAWGAALRPGFLAAIPVGLALGATLWWVARSDAIKQTNPFTTFLVSSELHRWNYGWLGLRFEPTFWLMILKNVTENVLSEGALALGVIAAAFATPRARRVALVGLLGFFTGPLVFANLYNVHDYYYTANALLLTGSAGVLIASAWDSPRITAGARWGFLVLALLFQYRAFHQGYHYHYTKEAPPPPAMPLVVRATTPPDGVLLVYGWDWNPLMAYYAQRRTIMVPDLRDDDLEVLEGILKNLAPRRVTALLLKHDPRRPHYLQFMKHRIARFQLAATPFATSADGDLYLTEDGIPGAAQAIGQGRFEGVTFNIQATGGPAGEPLPETDLSKLEFTNTSPQPIRARSRFGISVGTDERQQQVINAHPDSEIVFAPPPGANRIYAEFGIVDAAYRPGSPTITDGVTIEIIENRPDGLNRLIYRRTLDPAKVAGDRGVQSIALDPAGPFTGTLLFRITPGPHGNGANDWAYWGRIEIR